MNLQQHALFHATRRLFHTLCVVSYLNTPRCVSTRITSYHCALFTIAAYGIVRQYGLPWATLGKQFERQPNTVDLYRKANDIICRCSSKHCRKSTFFFSLSLLNAAIAHAKLPTSSTIPSQTETEWLVFVHHSRPGILSSGLSFHVPLCVHTH